MTAYYNEHDPYAAQWLRNLIKAGHIADGIVDERSIEDVRPDELMGYTQCHFFAGIGVWSYALRRAGWPDDRPVWTGSCPCQPFSTAGKREGVDDERHLWPAFLHLIQQCQPDTIFGEQVASKDGLGWLDIVQTDLEASNYANAAVDICAAGLGAPHIRQRLWFVAERMANTDSIRQQGSRVVGSQMHPEASSDREINRIINAGRGGWLADTKRKGLEGRNGSECCEQQKNRQADSCSTADGPPGPHQTNGFWKNADWLFSRDGRWRAVRSGTFPLVDGPVSRVGRLRAYGNAIAAPVAEAVISSYMGVVNEKR